MKKINIINKVFLLAILAMTSFSYAQPPIPVGGGGGIVGPGAPEQTPIDMYEGVLMIVATFIIAGYYFVRNRKQVN